MNLHFEGIPLLRLETETVAIPGGEKTAEKLGGKVQADDLFAFRLLGRPFIRANEQGEWKGLTGWRGKSEVMPALSCLQWVAGLQGVQNILLAGKS